MSFFSGSQIKPQTATPIFPSLQEQFGQWLLGQVGKGVPAYPGQINPSTSAYGDFTKATKMTGDPLGVSAMQQDLTGSARTPGILGPMAATGMAGGASAPGGALTNFMTMGSNLPNVAGAFNNMINAGVAGGSGMPLMNWGAISPQMAGMFMTPYAMGAPNPQAYRPPMIG